MDALTFDFDKIQTDQLQPLLDSMQLLLQSRTGEVKIKYRKILLDHGEPIEESPKAA